MSSVFEGWRVGMHKATKEEQKLPHRVFVQTADTETVSVSIRVTSASALEYVK